ncbi:MAG: hypothetical protein HXY37_07640, partial [Chloroflexi bacterium]|nr:hypothetical protein [Chloroflexota bacterium]
GGAARDEGQLGELAARTTPALPDPPAAGGLGDLLGATLPLVAALLVLQLTGNWLAALGLLIVGYGLVALLVRRA